MEAGSPPAAYRLAWAVVCALVLAGCAASQLLDPRQYHPAPLQFHPPAPREERLSGGAKVFLLEDHTVPLVRVYLSFRGGSVYDPPERAGLAQVAGLAWRTGGTASLRAEAVDDALEKKGMELSLSLGRDEGSASLSALSADAPEGLRLLADLVLRPAFEEGRVRWAVDQVLEGVRREADDPERLAYRELRRALYRGHPRGIAATEESVGRVRREDALALHRNLVTASSWTLGVVGDFEPQALLGALESLFGTLPGDGGGFAILPRPEEPAPRVVLVPKRLPQSTIVWARLGPQRDCPDFYPLAVADYLVASGGFQARLVREIRSDRGLAYSVGGFYDAYSDFGVIGAFASTKSASTAQVLRLLRDVLDAASSKPFEPVEVERAKEALVNRHVFRYEDPASAVKEEMTLALRKMPADLPEQFLPRILEVSPERVSGVAGAFYRAGPGVTVIVGDVSPDDPAWKDGPPVEVVGVP